MTVLDAVTGAVIGTTELDGTVTGSMQFNDAPGDVGYVTTTTKVPDTSIETTTVSVIDLSDGKVLSTWAPLSGSANGTLLFSADGTRAYRAVSVHHPVSDTYSTTVATFDVATGALIGTPIAMSGPSRGPLVLTADGNRLVQTINKYDPFTNTWVTSVATLVTGAEASNPPVRT